MTTATLVPIYTPQAEVLCRQMARDGRGELVDWSSLPIGQHYGPSGTRALIGFRATQSVIDQVRRAACRSRQAASATKPSKPSAKINRPSDGPMSEEEFGQIETALKAAAENPDRYGWWASQFADENLLRLGQYGRATRFSKKQLEVIWGIRLKMEEGAP